MNICITPESIKLFGSYVNRKLADRLTNDKTAEALLSELFNDALSVFTDNGLSAERNKELILQHMSIAPQIILKYAADNPKLSNAKSLGTIRELASDVIAASESETTDKFQGVIDRFGGFIGNTNNIVISEVNPLDRFEAVSAELAKTSNQEAIYNPLLGSYLENILDPTKAFEFAVARSIINNNNNFSLKFKLTTLGEVINDPAFENTTGSKDVNLPILILTDSKNNIAKFDSEGTIKSDGKYAAYTVKTNRDALKFQEQMLTEINLRTGIASNQKQANELAKKQVDNFVKAFNESLDKVKAGKTVFMNIDLTRSQLGFIAQNRNLQTPLSQISNLSTIAEPGKTLLKQSTEGTQFYPVLSVANTNIDNVRVFPKPLSTLTDQELEVLHYILSEPELKIEGYSTESANRAETRKKLAHFFIDSSNLDKGKTAINNPFEFYKETDGEKRWMIRFLNEEPIDARTLTLSKLKEWANAKFAKPVNRVLSKEEPAPKKSLAEANLGEYFTDENGNLFEAVGLRRSFANRRKASMNDNLNTRIPLKVDNGELKLGELITIGQHVLNNGYTTLVPTGENKLIGLGGYLAFKEGYEGIVENSSAVPENFDDIKFRSVPQVNSAGLSTDAQNKDALDWFPNNPLSKVVKLNFLNKVSEYGPNFLANFVNGSINLYLGSQPTDLYHEAFHAYFDGILSAEERKEIYDALRKTPGSFVVTVNGERKVRTFEDATNLELEEYLAEGFREFAMSNGKKTKFSNNKIVAFFQRLMSLLKNVFGNMSYAEAKAFNKSQAIADAMFTRLYKGEFNADTFNLENAETKWKSSEIETTTGDTFSLEEIHDAMSSMKSIMADFVTQGLNVSQNAAQRKEAVRLLLLMTQEKTNSEEYKRLSKALDNISETSIRSGAGVFSLVSNPDLLGLMVKYISNRLQQRLNEVNANIEEVKNISDPTLKTLSQSTQLDFQKQLLEKILKPENFGKISDLNQLNSEKNNEGKVVEKNLTSLFLKNYSNLVLGKQTYEDQYEAEALENDNFVPLFDRGGNDQMFDDTIEKGTIALLDSIHAYSEQGKGVPKLNALGFKEILPVKNMIAKVAKLLRNTPDAMTMAEILKNEASNRGTYSVSKLNEETGELEQEEVSFNDKEIDQLFRRLGDISQLDFAENMTPMEHRQWSNFWQSFNKADVLLREFILERVEKEDLDGNVTVTLESRSGQSRSQSTQVERQWKANFKTVGLTGEYSTLNNAGENVFDIESLIDDIANENEKFFGLIEGGGPALLTSLNSPLKLKSARYTKSQLIKGIADPYILFNALGINLVDDSEVRKILHEGNPELNIDGGVIADYILTSLKNRLSKVVWDASQEMYVRDTESGYIKSLDQVFEKFRYIDESGKIQEQPSLTGYLKQLRELQYYYSNDYTNFSSYNANGDLQSEKSFNSSLLNLAAVLNNAKSIEDVINTKGLEYLNPYTNPQAAASRWLIDMFQLDPEVYKGDKRGQRNWSVKITTENLSGSKLISKEEYYLEETNEETGEVVDKKVTRESDKGVASMAADQRTKFISDFHLTLEGKQEILRTEAKSTSMTVYASSIKGTEKRSGKNLVVNKEEVERIYGEKYNGKILFNEFKNHLAAEIIRINQVKKLESMILSGAIKPEDIVLDVEQLKRGSEWLVFDKIFDDNLKKELLKLNIDSVIGDKKFNIDSLTPALQTKVENALKKYFEEQASDLQSEMDSKLTVSDTLLNLYTNINEETKEAENIEDVKIKMYRTFLINNFIQNLNYSSLFLGDASTHNIEKDNFHKRIAGLISTGKIFRHDGVWLKYINSPQYNAYGFAKKHNEGNTKVNRDYVYDGFLKTAIIKEATSDSIYIEHYKNMLGIDTSKYNGMEEADGQGWLSFDAYRILNDSIGEWSDAQEELYQKMLAGKKLSQEDMVTTFPVRKFQYYGNVSNEKMDQVLKDLGINLNASAFHKYSLMPLIPALIENTPLQVMHEKMMEQGIDYVTMKTGSKLSTLSKVKVENGKIEADLDDFYNANDRQIVNADIEFTPNVIHVKYLKSQIFLDEGYKGYVTLPTQVRKIAMIGIMDGGVPTDFDFTGTPEERKAAWESLKPKQKEKASPKWTWLQKYTDTLDEMEALLRSKLLEDIALNETVVNGKKVYSGDSSKLANYLREKLKSKEILPEEISFLIQPDGTLIDDLSFSLINEKLEELLVTLVDKTLRRITVNGEALVQVSGSMFEKYDIKGGYSLTKEMLNNETLEEYKLRHGSNGLKFYFLQDENGKEILDPNGKAIVKGMDIKITLQGDFKKLLYTENAAGEKIAIYTTDENGKKILDYDASLKRLNDAIKTTYWQDKYGELIKIPGVRIPTQGPNSLVAATVFEFLPEWAGPVVILPTEIVSQSGADFDIDKLFMMFMNINNYNGKVEGIKYTKSNRTYEEIRESITKEESKLESADKKLQSAWQKYTEYLEQKAGMNKETGFMYDEINELQKDIDSLYAQKKAVYENKEYDFEFQKKLHEQLQREIDDKRSQKTTLLNFAKSEVNEFFDSEIKNKAERKAAIQENYDKYMAEINSAQEEVDAINESIALLQREMSGKGIKGLENRFFELLNERILMSDNLKHLVTPNSTKDTEGFARTAGTKIKRAYKKRDSLKTTIFDYRFNLLKHQENSVGKDSLGIAAVTATFYAIFTTYGATIQDVSEKDQDAFVKALTILQDPSKSNTPQYANAINIIDKFQNKKLNFAEADGKLGYNLDNEKNALTLGLMKNVDGQEISDIISQLINGYVDVAKDAWIFDAQGTKETTPVLLFMVMAGMNVEAAINLVNNPLVLEYNELLKENTGVFAPLSPDYNKREADSRGKTLEALSKKYSSAFNSSENILKTGSLSNFNRIANVAKPFSNDDLRNRLGQEPNYRDIEILSHFVQISQMAQAVTDFTMLTKFDTTKIGNISQAQERIEKIAEFKAIPIAEKIIPNEWFDKLQNSPVGKFNNDEFIVDLFSKYFKLRNNKALVIRSLDLKVKGVEKRKVLADFKNDFLWFLYQNAAYSGNGYTTSATQYLNTDSNKIEIPGKNFTLVEDTSIKGMEVNEETGEVKYSPNVFFDEANMLEFMFIRKFFNSKLPKEWVKFRLEYNNLVEASKSLSDEEFKKKFDIFDTPRMSYFIQGSQQARLIILSKAALYNTGNAEAMFDISAGVAPIVQNLKAKYPELNNYAFFRDIRYDSNEAVKKNNLYLPQIKDAQLASVYRENIQELKNSPHQDVRDFINRLDHIAIMQTGVNRGSKYSLLPIINQAFFDQMIKNQIGMPYVYQVLDELQKSFDSRESKKDIDAQIIDQFKKLYEQQVAGNGMRIKVRGANYIVDKLQFSKDITAGKSKIRKSNVTIIPLDKPLTQEQKELLVDYFYSDPSKSPFEIAESIKDMDWVMRNVKMLAPNKKSQKELDKALMIIGIDNTGELPKIKFKSKSVKQGFLSIAGSEVLKEKFAIKDEAMANSSTKAIGKVTTPFNSNYQSSSAAYTNALEKDYPGTLAKVKSTKEQFTKSDKVWVFGSMITEGAYSGNKKEDFINAVTDTFNSYHKPLIDKAIDAGVSSFFVGTASGIDEMAIKYLEEKGYKKVVRYSQLGTYNEMVSDTEFSKIEDPLYDPKEQDVRIGTSSTSAPKQENVFNTLLDVLYDSQTKRFTPKFFKDLTYSETINQGKDLVEAEIKKIVNDLDKSYKAANYVGFRIRLSNELKNIGAGRIVIGNSLFDSIVEETLMKFRDAVTSKNISQKSITIEDPVENNKNYNESLKTYLDLIEFEPLAKGQEVDVYFKSSDNDQELEIAEIQKLSNGMYKIKLDAGEGKQYTYTVDKAGVGEKIILEGFNKNKPANLFEKDFTAIAKAKAQLNQLALKEEVVKQGYLSVPIISPVKEKYKISRANDTRNKEGITSLSQAGRDPIQNAEGYKITFAEHPNAIFYLTPTYYHIYDSETGGYIKDETRSDKTGWQIENVNSGVRATNGDSVKETLDDFINKFNQLQNVSLSNNQAVDIISVTGMDINKLLPAEGAAIKYTYFSLPFTKEEKANILTNFTKKYSSKFRTESEAKQHIEDALAKANEQEQAEIIEKLKECYK